MKKPNLNSCHILEVGPDARRLWQYSVSGGQVKLAHEYTLPAAQPLPPKAGAISILQRRLNIAWLPADQVFLRVVQLPVVEWAELVSMVEFQLEKLSPFPINQIVWSLELLPSVQENQQTVIVIIAARDVVESFLGKLEADKFLAGQLELPQLHQLLTVPIDGDGVWIFPASEGNKTLCLVAWWFGGTLRQLQLTHLLAGANAASVLVAQLNETAWAGEMEGWLKSPVRLHLVAEPALAAEWDAALRQWSGQPVTVTAPLSKNALAELAARRAAGGASRANLLPLEFVTRYRQQFVDRLWMTGLGAVLATYIVGVLIYFAALYVMGWQRDKVVQQVKAISGSYTNAIRSRDKIEVLQNQLDLRFAALNTLLVVSDHLPEGFVLSNYTFSRGRSLSLAGTAPADQAEEINKYAKALRDADVDGHLIFTKVSVPNTQQRGAQLSWQLNCDLKRTDL